MFPSLSQDNFDFCSIQAHLENVAGSIPDYHNKVYLIIKGVR